MLRERGVQGRRAGLGGADQQEVGEPSAAGRLGEPGSVRTMGAIVEQIVDLDLRSTGCPLNRWT